MYACEKETEAYVVKGKLENVKDTMFFAARETGDSLHVDTIKVNDKGEFIFKGNVDTLSVISLYFKESVVSPYILVDKGWKVEVSGDIELPDLIMAKGGDINNDLTKFKTENKSLLTTRSQIVRNQENTADSILSKEHAEELANINFELLNIAGEYVKTNPTKIASVILINNFFTNEGSIKRLTEALDQLKGQAYDFPLTMQLIEYKDKVQKSAVGAIAPAFMLKDIDGNKKSLSDYRGKYVLLSFISTTCKVCNEMIPTVIKEYDILKKEKMNIEFVAVIKDVEDVPVTKDSQKDQKWVNLLEYGGWSSPIFEDYNIKELPYSILISKDGKILERNISIFNLKNHLESYPDIKKQ